MTDQASDIKEEKRQIDDLVNSFFATFTNKNGRIPNIESIFEQFVPMGTITKNVAGKTEQFSLQEFVAPRIELLTNGVLTEFEESEIAERTDIVGAIAQRVCTYKKSGLMAGVSFQVVGAKVFQFIKTKDGWRIASAAWDDEIKGVPLSMSNSLSGLFPDS